MGLPVGDSTTIYILLFTDYQVVIAQNVDDLEYVTPDMTRKLIKEWG